ncbi:MAG: flagellar basal body rod C-terminal domain-containing protein [Candidatus Sericytochromatia bacterium]
MRALERDFRQLEKSAQRVSRAGEDDSVDLSEERLEQLKAQRDSEAQVKAIQAQDEMLGIILDFQA